MAVRGRGVRACMCACVSELSLCARAGGRVHQKYQVASRFSGPVKKAAAMSLAKIFAFNFVPLLAKPVINPFERSGCHSLRRLGAFCGPAVLSFKTFRCCSTNDAFAKQESNGPTTLIVATRDDKASLSMANALLSDSELWEPLLCYETIRDLWRCRTSPVYLWLRSDSMLYHDNLDDDFTRSTGVSITDIIFISRHQSASGSPALTVHPIGNPGLPSTPHPLIV